MTRSAHRKCSWRTFPDSRQAVEYLIERGLVEDAATLVIAVFQFCLLHMISEVYGWAATLVNALEQDSPLLAEICGAAALGHWYEGDTERAIDLGERALRSVEFSRQPFAFWAHLALIDAYGYAGRAAEGFDHLRDFVAETRASDDPYWQIAGICFETIAYWLFDQTKSAGERIDEATALARDGSTTQTARSSRCIAWVSCSWMRTRRQRVKRSTKPLTRLGG